jgi:hypothetical protein
MRMFHGSSSDTVALHQGLCLTDADDAARDYANAAWGTHYLHTVDIDLDGLTVADAPEDWDRDENTAASDNGGDYDGADIIVYGDETPMNHRHVTYRLMTPAALAAVTIVASSDAGDY